MVVYRMESFVSKHPWISAGIGVVVIVCVAVLIWALWPETPRISRTKPPEEPETERIVNFIPSYELQPGMYWASQTSCDGAPGNGGLPGYCAFTGANAWANAEQTCDADLKCVGYAHMIRGGKSYYVLGAAVADTKHPPNLYYSKPGAETPQLMRADSSAYTIADVYKDTQTGPSKAEIAGAIWRASR